MGADALRARLPGVAMLTEPAEIAPYCRDWAGDVQGEAFAVLRPGSTAEVSRAVRVCRDLGLSIVPQGGNTGLVLGAIPDRPERQVVLSLDRMTRIRSLDADDFTASVDAGCVLQTLKDEAAKAGLAFPVSLGAQGSCRIGGNVSTNAGGLNVLRHGMMRNHVLGLEVVLPDGRVWDGMGRLLKDNRGPDLSQLFIGAEGIFGIVTGAKLRLVPAAERVETALLALESLEPCVALYRRARRDCSDLLSAFELMEPSAFVAARRAIPDLPQAMDETHPAYVLMEVSGSGLVDVRGLTERFLEAVFEEGAVLDGVLAASGAQAQDLWRIREGLNEGQALRGRHLRTDVGIPLSRIAGFVAAARARIEAELPEGDSVVYGHVGDGNVHFNVHPREPTDDAAFEVFAVRAKAIVNDEVRRVGGSISAEHGIGRVKREDFASELTEEGRGLLRLLKDAIDPAGVMNPGCILRPSGDV